MANNVRKQKIILLLVEGESDRKSFLPLEAYIKKTTPGFKESYKIKMEMIEEKRGKRKGGDLTTNPNFFKWANRSSQMETKIAATVLKFLNETNNHHLILDDIAEIMHVVDMDGAYIPDKNVISMSNSEKESIPENVEVIYLENTIHCRNYNPSFGPYMRNLIKREALDYLVKLKKIRVSTDDGKWKRSIPYHVFFMSCNLEHFFYNERNCSKIDKEKKSDSLVIAYSGSKAVNYFELFDRFDIPEMADYEESWKYIMKRNSNSLKRCSNVFLIDDLCKKKTKNTNFTSISSIVNE